MNYYLEFKRKDDGSLFFKIMNRRGSQWGLKWGTPHAGGMKIFVPADGMEEFKRNLEELIEEYGEISSAEQGIFTKNN